MTGLPLLDVLIVVAGLFLLFVPGRVARKRHHRNATAITVCQFFFWPVALIWAFTDNCEPIIESSPSTEVGGWVRSGGLAYWKESGKASGCPTCGKPDCADLSHAAVR
jgi:hypothetical protein